MFVHPVVNTTDLCTILNLITGPEFCGKLRGKLHYSLYPALPAIHRAPLKKKKKNWMHKELHPGLNYTQTQATSREVNNYRT